MLSTSEMLGFSTGAPGTLFFEVVGVTAFYESLQTRLSVHYPLNGTDDGMPQFMIRDPDGHVLVFAEENTPNADTALLALTGRASEYPHDVYLMESVGRQGWEKRIQIIKELRDHTSKGLAGSKNLVDDFIDRRGPGAARFPSGVDLDGFLTEFIDAGRRAGRTPDKLALVKHFQAQTGCGLAVPKRSVDSYCERHQPDL